MTIAELRLLGDYRTSDHSQETACCNPTYVYYVGFDRQRREQLIQQDIGMKRAVGWSQIRDQTGQRFYVSPAAGVTWQEQRGTWDDD